MLEEGKLFADTSDEGVISDEIPEPLVILFLDVFPQPLQRRELDLSPK